MAAFQLHSRTDYEVVSMYVYVCKCKCVQSNNNEVANE